MPQRFKNTANFLDDIIVTGSIRTEYLCNQSLKKLDQAGFKLIRNKCAYFQDEVCYLLTTISKERIKRNKQKAIIDAPRQTIVTLVKNLSGLVKYYSKFVPNLAILTKPIYDLLKSNKPFVWSDACDMAFR